MSRRYGVRQILYEEGFEIPYEMVPDGIRSIVYDVYPNPGWRHFWNASYLGFAALIGYKFYRVLGARIIFKQHHPHSRIGWKLPFKNAGKAKWL